MPFKVVFVPGVPASKLHEANADGSLGDKVFPPHLIAAFRMTDSYKEKLQGPDDLLVEDGILAGEPIASTKLLGFDLTKQASSLYRVLSQCGIEDPELAKVGWDWRRPVTGDNTQWRLAKALQQSADGVVIIAHSTGGLVVRHFLENNPELSDKVGRIIAFGVPWAGALKALAALVGQQAFGPIGKEDAQEIFAYAWSAFDLLPRRSSGLVIDSNDTPVNLLTSYDWIPEQYRDAMKDRARYSKDHLGEPKSTWRLDHIPVTNLVGWGVETQVLARVTGSEVVLNPQVQAEVRRLGDGTAALGSAAWLQGNVATLSIPIGGYPRSGKEPHSTLWRNPGGADMLRHLLGGASLSEFAYAAVDWSDKLDPARKRVRIRFVLQQLDGAPLAGGFARLANIQDSKEAGVDTAGRGMISVSRTRIPKTQGGRFRRLRVELHWPGAVKPKPQTFLVEP